MRGFVTSYANLPFSASYPVRAVNAKIPEVLPVAPFHLISRRVYMALMMFYGKSFPAIGTTTSYKRSWRSKSVLCATYSCTYTLVRVRSLFIVRTRRRLEISLIHYWFHQTLKLHLSRISVP